MANEVANNLRSRAFARIVDLISEGPIRGVVNGLKGVYFDGTPLQAANGSLAYSNLNIQFVNGYPAQGIMTGFSSQEADESVNLQLFYLKPLVRTIINPDADRVRITLSVPQLVYTDKKGQINGMFVDYRIEIAPSSGTFQWMGDFEINGKTTSRYQRQHIFGLPGVGPWQVRVTRQSSDPTTTDISNDLYWDAFTTIIDDRVNYTRSACVGVTIDSEQFSSIPKRSYLVDGLLVLLPTNYDPYGAVYYGAWDGSFKQDWTNNPAWIFYDLVINNRYGLGAFITPDLVDVWSVYKVGVFCDQLVDNGKGGYERRFTCNVQITTQSEAFDLLAQVASVFRGFAYWAGGHLVAIADQPTDPVAQFSNANVIDGSFTYTGADIRARHTMANTAFADPQVLGEKRFAIVESKDQISRWGIQSLDDDGFGSTSESQSIRTGKWGLYTEQYESEVTTFNTGMEAAFVRPGDIIRISDANVAGDRMGGRVVHQDPSNSAVIIVDLRPPMVDGRLYYLSCIIPSGEDTVVITRNAYLSATPNGITVSPAFPAAPVPGSVFVLNDPVNLQPTLWRTTSVRQTDIDKYEISGMRHFPQKWDYIEHNIAFSLPDISNIGRKPPPVTALSVREYLVQTSAISIGVRAVISWTSQAPQFDIYWRLSPSGNWSIQRTDGYAIDVDIIEGVFDFRVVPISSIGVRGDATQITKEIIGRYAPPSPPTNFRIHVVEGVAMFDWSPVTDLDVIIGGYFQLRHTATLSTGVTWTTAQIVVPKIPGTATSVEATYQPGTWMLRTFDIVDVPSTTWALIIGTQEDQNFKQWTRICESPDYLGNHNNTTVRMPQEWLTINGINMGYVDDQPNIDDWPQIDVTPVPPGQAPGPNTGVYTFEEGFDAGSSFSVRFSADVLAFPYADPGDWFDDRLVESDIWSNWDDLEGDYGGQIFLQIRTTDDDPSNPNAIWTNWTQFITGEYFARGFQFRVVLSAPPGQNIGVETLCVIGDFKAKYDEGNDIPYTGADNVVYFNVKFYNVPAVVITVQNALESDRITMIDKQRDYFILRITDAAGTQQQPRSFDWHAQGY